MLAYPEPPPLKPLQRYLSRNLGSVAADVVCSDGFRERLKDGGGFAAVNFLGDLRYVRENLFRIEFKGIVGVAEAPANGPMVTA